MPNVFASEIQSNYDGIEIKAYSNQPSIIDDTNTITEDMKSRLLNKFEQQYSDNDLSDFIVKFTSNDNSNFDNPSNDYLFDVFYNGIIVCDEKGSNSRVFLGVRNGNDYEAIFKPQFVNECKKLDFNNLIKEDDIKKALISANKVSNNDDCTLKLVIYNYLTTGMVGSDKIILAYKIFVKGNHPDMEYIVDANSGDIIKSNSSVVPSNSERIKIDDIVYLKYNDYAELVSCDMIATKVTIPDNINDVPLKKIGSDAFNNCVSLTQLIIPDSVEEIGNNAFYGCSSLVEIKLPANLKVIEQSLFKQCQNITEITIPNGVVKIEESAFYNCKSLSTIYIPISVTEIQKNTFGGCGNLTDVYYEGSKTEWNELVSGLNINANIHYNSQNINFFLKGDVNADGKFTVADVVMLKKWLLAVPDVTLPNWKAADLCEDGVLNVFDLCMMKRELIGNTDNKQDMTMNDVFELSKKGKNLTWSDFENYQHGQDIGSGLAVYEFKIANYSNRFTLVVGYSDENSLQYVRLKSSGSTIDITESSENDIMMFIAKYNPPA